MSTTLTGHDVRAVEVSRVVTSCEVPPVARSVRYRGNLTADGGPAVLSPSKAAAGMA